MLKVIEKFINDIKYFEENPYEDDDKRFPYRFPRAKDVLLALELFSKLPSEINRPNTYIFDGIVSLDWKSNNWKEWDLGMPQIRKSLTVSFYTNYEYKRVLWWHKRIEKEPVIQIIYLTPQENHSKTVNTVDDVLEIILPLLNDIQFKPQK